MNVEIIDSVNYPVLITVGGVEHAVTVNDAKILWAMLSGILIKLKEVSQEEK